MKTVYTIAKEFKLDEEVIFEFCKKERLIPKTGLDNKYGERERDFIKRGIITDVNLNGMITTDPEIVNIPELQVIPDTLTLQNVTYKKIGADYNVEENTLTIQYQHPSLEGFEHSDFNGSEWVPEEKREKSLNIILDKFEEYANQL